MYKHKMDKVQKSSKIAALNYEENISNTSYIIVILIEIGRIGRKRKIQNGS